MLYPLSYGRVMDGISSVVGIRRIETRDQPEPAGVEISGISRTRDSTESCDV